MGHRRTPSRVERARPLTLFATHYHELNDMSQRFSRIVNVNVSVKELDGNIVFLRKLAPGGSNHSFGIHVAKLAGMPRSLVRRAEEVLTVLGNGTGRRFVFQTRCLRSEPARRRVANELFPARRPGT